MQLKHFQFPSSAQTTKAFLPAMLEKDHGHVVTIASLAGHVGISKLVDYCSSKFAAVGFDEALRLELELLGSQVETTCVCPFFIQATGMFEDVNARYEWNKCDCYHDGASPKTA